MSGSFDFEIV